jgi:HlyD family secretion protein
MNMKKLSRKKKVLYGICIVVVLAIVVLAATKKHSGNGIKVIAEKVQKRTIIETVSANGKIQPEVEVKITPYISGEVIEIYVREGDRVKAGDLLAVIDPEIYKTNYEQLAAGLEMQKANLASTKALLAQAKARLVNAEESYKRNKKLFEEKVISVSDFDNIQASYEVAKAEAAAAEESVKAAQYTVNGSAAALKEAQENLSRTTIAAPTDGTVSKLSVEKGERVTGASQFSPGTEIMRIANLSSMEVNVEVNENDIVRVSLGDTSTIEVDAYLNKKFLGVVTEIATSAETQGTSADQVTNFNVKIRILPESYKDIIPTDTLIKSPFRPGMSATVDIQTESAKNVLSIPIQAVTARVDTTAKKAGEGEAKKEGEGGFDNPYEETVVTKKAEEVEEIVFLLDGNKAKKVVVKTGIQDNTYIQITEGLDEGVEVITGPYRAVSKKLKDGDEVKKVDKAELYASEEE